MAEAPPERTEAPPEATPEDSRGGAGFPGRFRSAAGDTSTVLRSVTVLGVLAGALMTVAEFSTIASVDVAAGACEVINDSSPAIADRCELSGFERHGGALVLLGLVAAAMGVGAGLGGSRPAGAALIVIGLVVLGLSLGLDLPEAGETGAIGRNFEGAEASAGRGLYVEIVAGALAVAAGLLRLTRGG